MATSRLIELETGTHTARIHPHNGYYAGDFFTPRHETKASDAWMDPRLGSSMNGPFNAPAGLPPNV